MTDDKTRRLKIDDVMDVYTSWCEARKMEPATRIMMGHVVKKYFSPVVRLKTVNRVRKYSYEAMMFREDVYELSDMSMLTHQENVFIRMNGAILEVQIKMKYIRDGEDVRVLASLNTASGTVAVNMHGKQLSEAFMKQNGLYTKDVLSQKFVDGFTRIAANMRLCMGKDFQVTDVSSIPEQHVWVINSGVNNPEIIRLHSKNCELVLKFSTNYETVCCGHCVHDLGYVSISYVWHNAPKNLIQPVVYVTQSNGKQIHSMRNCITIVQYISARILYIERKNLVYS